MAQLNPGEVVLDLGSGGGIDVLLSAKRVGPNGKAYGLDMTDEMLALARKDQEKAGLQNVEFLKGEIEQIPLPDNSADVIISNCVINLSADKDRVFREAFRVLKPGGRFAVSDVVVRGEIPTEIRKNVELWIGCVAGALEENHYRSMLSAAGFEHVELEPTRVYRAEEAREFLQGSGIDIDAILDTPTRVLLWRPSSRGQPTNPWDLRPCIAYSMRTLCLRPDSSEESSTMRPTVQNRLFQQQGFQEVKVLMMRIGA